MALFYIWWRHHRQYRFFGIISKFSIPLRVPIGIFEIGSSFWMKWYATSLYSDHWYRRYRYFSNLMTSSPKMGCKKLCQHFHEGPGLSFCFKCPQELKKPLKPSALKSGHELKRRVLNYKGYWTRRSSVIDWQCKKHYISRVWYRNSEPQVGGLHNFISFPMQDVVFTVL